MSALGQQMALDAPATGEWELIGRDMIRTKRTADGGGFIVAQFWTSPAPEHAAVMVAAPALLEACKEFVRKVEAGEARSQHSYAQMKTAIALAECAKPLSEVAA